MKSVVKILSIIQLIAILQSCGVSRQRKFVDKYGTENFSNFLNKGISIRNQTRNLLNLVISYDLENAKFKGPYIVSIDNSTGAIVSSDLSLVDKGHPYIDTSALNKLAMQFINYNVKKISVDKNGNVFIGIKSNERNDLVRFSNPEYKTIFYKKWKHIKNNWYQKL